MDQAHVRHDLPHPAALQLADEVPLEQLAVRGDLASRSCARFSPTSRTPACGERAADPPRPRTWSPRAARPRAGRGRRRPQRRGARSRSRPRSRFARIRAASRPLISSTTPRPPGGPRGAPSRRWEKKRSSQIVQRAEVADLADAGREQAPRGDRAQVDRRRRRGRCAEAPRGPPRRPRSSRARRRARSRRSSRSAAAELAQRRTPLLEHAGGEPAPAGVDHRHRAARSRARPAGSRR